MNTILNNKIASKAYKGDQEISKIMYKNKSVFEKYKKYVFVQNGQVVDILKYDTCIGASSNSYTYIPCQSNIQSDPPVVMLSGIFYYYYRGNVYAGGAYSLYLGFLFHNDFIVPTNGKIRLKANFKIENFSTNMSEATEIYYKTNRVHEGNPNNWNYSVDIYEEDIDQFFKSSNTQEIMIIRIYKNPTSQNNYTRFQLRTTIEEFYIKWN